MNHHVVTRIDHYIGPLRWSRYLVVRITPGGENTVVTRHRLRGTADAVARRLNRYAVEGIGA